jgi:hypothetical protein
MRQTLALLATLRLQKRAVTCEEWEAGHRTAKGRNVFSILVY